MTKPQVIDEDGNEVPYPTTAPIDLDAWIRTNAAHLPALREPTDPQPLILGYEIPQTRWALVKEALVDGTVILRGGQLAIVGTGIATVVLFVQWVNNLLVAATSLVAEYGASVLTLVVLTGLAVVLSRGSNPKHIYLKGCPTRSPGVHKIRVR